MISSDRQSHWIHLIVEGLLEKKLLQCADKDKLIRSGMRAMFSFIEEHSNIDKKTRNKIASLKRKVSPASSEWEVLYSRYYEEELSRTHLRQGYLDKNK